MIDGQVGGDAVALAVANLDDNGDVTVASDQVELIAADPHIAAEDAQTLSFEEAGGQAFLLMTE